MKYLLSKLKTLDIKTTNILTTIAKQKLND